VLLPVRLDHESLTRITLPKEVLEFDNRLEEAAVLLPSVASRLSTHSATLVDATSLAGTTRLLSAASIPADAMPRAADALIDAGLHPVPSADGDSAGRKPLTEPDSGAKHDAVTAASSTGPTTPTQERNQS